MVNDPGPLHLSKALTELIALRGFARVQGDAQLQADWDRAAGNEIAPHTRVGGLSRGTLQVMVANPALLAELNGFHKATILLALQQSRPDYKVKHLKFKLQSNLKKRELK
ncbi:MAG: DUF721 domain-containing protein [Planctomycetota bacterium]